MTTITPEPKNFFNFILNGGYDSTHTNHDGWNVEDFLSPHDYYRELNFTGVQMYDNLEGTNHYGRFAVNLSSGQIGNTQNLINSINGSNNSVKSVIERSNISRLCYGQRLVYEVNPTNNTHNVNFGFCYQNHGGSYTTDNGRTVLQTSNPSLDSPQGYYLCQNIYENLMHSDLLWFPPGYGDTSHWHIKPVMKIDPYDAINHPDAEVVRIKIRKFNGDYFPDIIIKAGYFRDINGNYNGDYTIDYIIPTGQPVLNVPGDKTDGLNKGWVHDGLKDNCNVDFKVYWSGQVNVYFDKLVVDDEIANVLLRNNTSSNYDAKIYDETNFNNFYTICQMIKDKQFSYSNKECVKYILNKMYDKLQNQATPISLK